MELLLQLPVLIVNMDRCEQRLETTMRRVKEAGFTDVTRFRAVDGQLADELASAWLIHGSPEFDQNNTDFNKYKGEQGCLVTHLNIWKHIIDYKMERVIVFEDDVFFHKDWCALAPEFFKATPQDYDILYMGSQMELASNADVCVVPVYCTHAYVISQSGARKLYDHVTNTPGGMCAIDTIIINTMFKVCTRGMPSPFKWYVWNATRFRDDRALVNTEWAKRNHGLVFQDFAFGTFVKPRPGMAQPV